MTAYDKWSLIINGFAAMVSFFLFSVIAYQIYHYRQELRGRTILDIKSATREILAFAIRDPRLLALFEVDNTDTEREVLSRYAQLWINHAHGIWHLRYSAAHLNFDEWYRMREDMKNLFSLPLVEERWERWKNAYPGKFQNFVGNLQEEIRAEKSAAP